MSCLDIQIIYYTLPDNFEKSIISPLWRDSRLSLRCRRIGDIHIFRSTSGRRRAGAARLSVGNCRNHRSSWIPRPAKLQSADQTTVLKTHLKLSTAYHRWRWPFRSHTDHSPPRLAASGASLLPSPSGSWKEKRWWRNDHCFSRPEVSRLSAFRIWIWQSRIAKG